jgi:uroporphyrinogen-III synthase
MESGPLDGAADQPLRGRVVGVTAERRAREQTELLERRGARVVHGPTLATVDVVADPALREVTDAVAERPPGWLVVGTGFGVRHWFDAAERWGARDRLVAALSGARTRVVARGAKGASAVRQAGLDVAWRATGESMAEVVAHLAAELAGAPASTPRRVALQLFDPDDHPSTVAIRRLLDRDGDELVEIPVYRWRLPPDVAPAQQLVDRLVAGELDAVTFTSQPAVRFLDRIASQMGPGVADGVRAAFAAGGPSLAVCVGAVCAEAAAEVGYERVVWPDPPRLVPMVRLLEERLTRS